jgi:hypothetical protein
MRVEALDRRAIRTRSCSHAHQEQAKATTRHRDSPHLFWTRAYLAVKTGECPAAAHHPVAIRAH